MAMAEVIYFDVNETLLDMSPVRSTIAEALGGDDSLVPLWFSTLLHHSLVDCATGQFHPFSDIAGAALVMVARNNGYDIVLEDAKENISNAMMSAPAHADAKPALERLRDSKHRLVALSNSSINGLEKQLSHAGVIDCFDRVMSVESIRTYKPYPAVYHWALREMGITARQGLMVAAHGWDISGAKGVGMQTAFIKRAGKSTYPLGLAEDFVEDSLTTLVEKLTSSSSTTGQLT